MNEVVFDASAAPEDRPKQSTHKGLTVIYAVDEENADARIEQLIAAHSSPKGLTPTTPITHFPLGEGDMSAGHSTNFKKLKR